MNLTPPPPSQNSHAIRWHIIIIIIIIIIISAHQHKAAGRKTRLDIQNYGCNGNLLCYHGVVERNRISSLQSHRALFHHLIW